MTLKKVKILNVLFLFSLSFLWHFVYQLIPFKLTAIFFPVNESIWEHMKIIYGTFIVVSIIQIIICKKFKININNKYIEMITKAILGVIFYLIIFIPVYKIIGENMIFAISLMFITYLVMEFFSIKILESPELNINILPIIIIILGFVLFGLLTFYPAHTSIFFDDKSLGYGILK